MPIAIALLFTGFASMLGQLLIIRELAVVFVGNELFIGVTLGVWLFWVCLGSAFYGKKTDGIKDKTRLFALCLAFLAVFLPLEIFLARISRAFLGLEYGRLAGILPLFYTTLFILMPCCLVIGLVFRLGCALLGQKGAIGRAYVLESAGASSAGFLFTYCLADAIMPFRTAMFLGVVSLVISAALLSKKGRAISFILAGSLCLAVFLGQDKLLESVSRNIQWQGNNLIAEKNSKYGHLAVTKTEEVVSLFENGIISLSAPDVQRNEQVSHWAMLSHKQPKDVLIINGAYAGILAELLKHSPKNITYLELDPQALKIMLPYLSPQDKASLSDERVDVVNMDARAFLTCADKRFDCIIVNAAAPSNAFLNRFYTLEFYNRLKNALNPDGVVLIPLYSSENYLSLQTRLLNASIYKTIKRVFTHTYFIPGETVYVIAGEDSQIERLSPAIFIERLVARRLKNQYITVYQMPFLLQPERISFTSQSLGSRTARLNSDFKPIAYFYNFLLWKERFSSPFNILNFAAGLCILFILLKRFLPRWPGIAVSVFAVGFFSMAMEIILIIAYQSIWGYVFKDIGSLMGSFMLGLVLGAIYSGRFHGRSLKLFLALCAGYAITAPALIKMAGQREFLFLVCLDGILAGFVFALAGQIYNSRIKDPASAGGALYAADVAGAGIGGILTSIFFIPLFGIGATCLICAGVVFLAIIPRYRE